METNLPSIWRRSVFTVIGGALLSLALSLSAQTPRNVILFIGDGMGSEHVKAARLYQGASLSFESLPKQAQVTTRSANDAITDSAAGATAMATGYKVNNGVISVALPGNGAELQTTLEYFKNKGKATGLVTTTYLTHATPAAFGAHEPDRNSTTAIGTDLMTQTLPNVLFGGGGNGLSAATAIEKGYQVATDTTGFESLDPSNPMLCGLFGTGHLPYEEDYLSGQYPAPHLRDMVVKALDALGRNENGFFLMVEAGRIDHAAGTSTLPEMIHETLELSRAVQVALDWMGNRTDTLLIVTADHETGGLTVTQDNGTGNYPAVTWSSSYNHTAANVPAYALGMDAERIAGTLDNTYIRAICTGEALSIPTPAVTLIPKGATWKYEASGANLGTAWRAITYNDTTWPSGPAELGYGDGGEATLLPASPVHPCYYFRHKFQVANPAAWSSLSFEILKDDGAVVYLNGQEVARYNMPAGTVAYGTWASSANDYTWDPPTTIPNLLVAGENVLAVEVHQGNSISSDMSLDLKLTGNAILTVTPDAPIAGAIGVTIPATLTVTATDPAANPLTIAFYGRPAPAPGQTGPAFQLLQQTAGVPSGTAISAIWTGLIPGAEYEWFAMATDGPERIFSETRRFTTLDNVPPTIAITSPHDGATFSSAPASVTITAEASDPDGSVASLELFANGVTLGTATAAPYTFNATLQAGSYTLTAVATDDDGATSTSPAIQITVGAPPTAPSVLAATAASRTQVDLAWIDNSTDETRFEIYQAVGLSSYSLVGTTDPNVTGVSISGLQPATTYSFKVRAVNISGYAESAVASATTLENAAPGANPDSYTTGEDTVLGPGASVLANDSDADDNLLIAILQTPPSHGTISLGLDGSFTYTPNANFNGQDSFTYQARDPYFIDSPPATVTITVTAVNDLPTVPPNVIASASAGRVTLSWSASTDPDGDVLEYRVYRAETSGAYGQPLATVPGLGYTDTAVVNGTTYYYVIAATDASEESLRTIEVSATPDNLPVYAYVSANPVVSSGTVVGDYIATIDADGVSQTITEAGLSTGARLQADYTLVCSANPAEITAISLVLNARWSAMDGAADPILVYLWNNSAPAWEQITLQQGEFSAASPKDFVSTDGKILVRFTDGAVFRREKKDTLNIDQLFARIVAGPPDTTSPSAPADLVATAGDTQVQLDWADNVEPDVVGYNVYRSTAPNSGYEKVNTALVSTSFYQDSGLINGTTYYYAVSALDRAGNKSVASTSANATPVDMPPAAPSGLIATAGNGQVTLDWAANTESDVQGYHVYRWSGAIWTPLTTTPITINRYLDTGLANGTEYTYVVTAVDATQESPASSPVKATPNAQATMHVESITMNPLTLSGKSYKASGIAYLVDSANTPLSGAAVTAEWWFTSGGNSSLLQTQTVTSGGGGATPFTSPPVKAASGSTFTLRITGVSLGGYLFAPADGLTEAVSPDVP